MHACSSISYEHTSSLISVFGATPKHIPLKYTCSNKMDIHLPINLDTLIFSWDKWRIPIAKINKIDITCAKSLRFRNTIECQLVQLWLTHGK